MRGAAVLVALAWCARAAAALLPLEVERLRAGVGGFAVMNCHLDFPFGNEIPYHLQWDKDIPGTPTPTPEPRVCEGVQRRDARHVGAAIVYSCLCESAPTHGSLSQGESIFSWYSGDAAPAVADRWGGRVQRVGGGGGALGGGAINVSAVRETDAGLYRCRVTFPNRTPPARNNGTFYYLDVDGGNLIATPPVNVTVLEGDRAELECRPKSDEWTVAWYKDGEPLDTLPELAARAEQLANGSLVLRRALSSDPGEYSCRVHAPPDLHQSAAAHLDVQYKAKVVYAPEERSLAHGQPASLDCHFSANPPLTNLRWEKDGFLFDPYNVPGVFYSRNGSLLFNQVDESHEGEYSCTPYNALGTEGPSPRVRVRVQRPPALAARPAPLYLARLGQALALPCAAAEQSGHAPPTLTWARKDGTPLPEGRHALDGARLTIADVAEQDAGVYVCTARNDAAALSAETELRIENAPPRAPHALAARPAAAAVHLAWRPGAPGAAPDYTVWYRARADTEWRTMRLLTRGATEATLLGLRPSTEYELRVLAQDSVGDGLFSRPVFVRTLDAEAEGSGQEAHAAAAEPGGGGELQVAVRLLDEGALVRWQRAPGDESRCTVRWLQGAPPGERQLLALHTHHDYALVGGVEEGERYWARVECVSGAAGGVALRVPEYGRLRGAAAGAAAAALLLAALAAALYLARRRVWPARAAPAPRAPPPPARVDKRRR